MYKSHYKIVDEKLQEILKTINEDILIDINLSINKYTDAININAFKKCLNIYKDDIINNSKIFIEKYEKYKNLNNINKSLLSLLNIKDSLTQTTDDMLPNYKHISSWLTDNKTFEDQNNNLIDLYLIYKRRKNKINHDTAMLDFRIERLIQNINDLKNKLPSSNTIPKNKPYMGIIPTEEQMLKKLSEEQKQPLNTNEMKERLRKLSNYKIGEGNNVQKTATDTEINKLFEKIERFTETGSFESTNDEDINKQKNNYINMSLIFYVIMIIVIIMILIIIYHVGKKYYLEIKKIDINQKYSQSLISNIINHHLV